MLELYVHLFTNVLQVCEYIKKIHNIRPFQWIVYFISGHHCEYCRTSIARAHLEVMAYEFWLGCGSWILVRAVLGMQYFEPSGDVHQDISMSWGVGGQAHLFFSTFAHPLLPPLILCTYNLTIPIIDTYHGT